ncbi:hypothetical protein AB0F45_36540, partial [Streptomyces achromogenes]
DYGGLVHVLPAGELDAAAGAGGRAGEPSGGEDGVIAVRLSSGLVRGGAAGGRVRRLPKGPAGGLSCPGPDVPPAPWVGPEQRVHSGTCQPGIATGKLKFASGEVHAASDGT